VAALNILKGQVKIVYDETGNEELLTTEECLGILNSKKN
jgi:hypothetical protein